MIFIIIHVTLYAECTRNLLSNLSKTGDTARNHINEHNKQDLMTRVYQALVRAR